MNSTARSGPNGAAGQARSGFTLMELLVTISIIAMLAAILLPAINSAIKRAEVARAQVQVAALEAAVREYFQRYNQWPSMLNSGSAKTDAALVRVLGARGTDTANNPDNVRFMEFPEESIDNDRFLDPWEEKEYEVYVDHDYNGQISVPGAKTLYRNAAVRSLGPDGAPGGNDDIVSWK